MAIIAGRKQRPYGFYVVEQIIFPAQVNNTNTSCEISDNVQVDNYFNNPVNEGLVQLGIIHSHPKPYAGTPSSVDLHQLCSLIMYQGPQMISVIYEEETKNFHFYTLTSGGVDALSKCMSGPCRHEENPLLSYFIRSANHVKIDEVFNVEVENWMEGED